MNKFVARLKDPYTYLGLASFGSVFGIKELAQLGVPEVATSMAAVVGIFASLFGETTTEKKARQGEPPAG